MIHHSSVNLPLFGTTSLGIVPIRPWHSGIPNLDAPNRLVSMPATTSGDVHTPRRAR